MKVFVLLALRAVHSLAPGLPFYKGPPQRDTRQTSSFQPASKRGHVTASVSQPRRGGGPPSSNLNSRPPRIGPASATPPVGRSTPQPAWSRSPGLSSRRPRPALLHLVMSGARFPVSRCRVSKWLFSVRHIRKLTHQAVTAANFFPLHVRWIAR